MSSAPEIRPNPEHDIDFYKMTVEDIARTKNRQYQITYYSALVTGSLIIATRIISEMPEKALLMLGLIVAGITTNAIATTVFQFQLDGALHKFRTRLHSIGARLGRANEAPTLKRSRDLPLTLYLVAFPWAVALFAAWYAVEILS